MKSKNWLELPVVWGGIYPPEIQKLAAKLEVSAEQIAKDKGIEPNVIRDEYLRRDDVELVYKISGDPEDANRTLIWMIDGNVLSIALPSKTVMKKIDNFLGENHIFHKRALQLQFTNETFEEDDEEERN